MSPTTIDAGKQIRAATITNAEISASAGIALTKLSEAVLQADGGQAFTADMPAGGFKITGLGNGVADTDAMTVGQGNAIFNGQDTKVSCRIATTGSESFTIAGGAVTQIAGTTVDGVTTAVGNRILIKNAPATTGTGTADDSNVTGTSQPANGIYRVTNATTNTTVVRDSDADASAEVTAGMTTTVAEGTAGADAQWTLVSNDAITLNTTPIQFTRTDRSALSFSGGLTKTGAGVKRDDFTGDVTTTGNGNATTIANDAVTFAKMANLAANSVIGNLTGSTADPAAVSAVSAATASTVATRDANANVRFNNAIENFQTVTSAAGTTTLTVGSPKVTQITGSTTQTVVLPDATTLVVGQAYTITNRSSGAVTVNANGGGLIQTMVGGSFVTLTVTAIGTAAGSWDAAYTAAGGSGSVTSVTVAAANGFAATVASQGTTPVLTLQATPTGLLKSNGTAISAASNTAAADYANASNFVTRETPSGTVNGSNVTFTLAFTPVSGTEQVFLNGILQEPGAGNDYTISGATITYLTAPIGGGTPDKIRVSYIK